ncbi:MAG: TIGR02391 family protein [Acidimicrobiales bacterium]
MSGFPAIYRDFGTKKVVIIHDEGGETEQRREVEAHIQVDSGFFGVETPVYDGDAILIPDERGGTDRMLVTRVDVNDFGPASLRHIEVKLSRAPAPRVAGVRRLGLENLHHEVIAAANDLFVDGHYSQAVFEALKALEQRVRAQSNLEGSGRDLMSKAFAGAVPPIDLSVESGQSGRDEQEGLRLVFMGLLQGVRNPKGHLLVIQDDPQRALEYLGLVSVLFRRLDDAAAKGNT